MITSFEGDTADEVWQKAAAQFRCANSDKVMVQPSRAGDTDEILHSVFSIEDPIQRWVVSRSPALNPAFALAEVIWILQGRGDINFLKYWNRQITEYIGDETVTHGAYGPRLRKRFELDQIERVYRTLRREPQTRRAVMQIYHPKDDLLQDYGEFASNDIPCNITSILKIRDEKLQWTQVIRSNDLFLGVPHNFVQFTTLQEIIAGWLDIEVGTYNQFADSLHVYDDKKNDVEASKPVDLKPNEDSLRLPKTESDKAFDELENRADTFVGERLSIEQHRKKSRWSEAPEGIQNILSVLGAEAARRRSEEAADQEKSDWVGLSRQIMDGCSNPAYVQLWEHWVERVS